MPSGAVDPPPSPRMLGMARQGAWAAGGRDTLVRSAFVLSADDIGRRVVSGASFQFLGMVLRTVLTIGSTAVLARLLAPADFGYVVMATVVTEFAAVFANFGFTNVLVQRRVINRLQLDTVFWVSAGLGAFLALAVFLASFFAGWLFADAVIGDLLRVLCLTFVFSSLTAAPSAILARLMRFRTEFLIQVSSLAVRAGVAIACAFGGLGMWSLVIAALAGSAFSALANFAAVRYVPRLRFSRSYIASTWRTNGSYLGSGLLFYISMNVDLVLIGRSLGATSLGFYQNARALTDEIRARIATRSSTCCFPPSRQCDRTATLHALLLRSGSVLAAIVIPVGLGVSANARELVLVLYGEQWRSMSPGDGDLRLQRGGARGSTAVVSPLFNARNRVGLSLRYSMVGTALLAAAVAVALPHGVERRGPRRGAGLALTRWCTMHAGLALVGLGCEAHAADARRARSSPPRRCGRRPGCSVPPSPAGRPGRGRQLARRSSPGRRST